MRPRRGPVATAGGKRRRTAQTATRSAADRLVVTLLEFELDHKTWTYRFSRAHPDLRLEVEKSTSVPENLTLADFDVYGPPGFDWTSEICRYADVFDVDRFQEIGEPDHYQVTLRRPPHLVIADDLRVLLRYPRTVQNGLYRCELVARLSRIRLLLRALRKISARVRLVRMGRRRLRSVFPIFSPAQRQLFRYALSLGYFEVPRRVTLTELAQRLGLSKSSVSEGLAKIEKRLFESAAAMKA